MHNAQVSGILISQPKNGLQAIQVPGKDGVTREFVTTEEKVDEFLSKRKRINRGAALMTGLLDVGSIIFGLSWINSLRNKWLFKKIGKIGRGISGTVVGFAIALIGAPIIEKLASKSQTRLADKFVKTCEKNNQM